METKKKRIIKGEIATAIAFYLETAAFFGLQIPCNPELKQIAERWKPDSVLEPKG